MSALGRLGAPWTLRRSRVRLPRRRLAMRPRRWTPLRLAVLAAVLALVLLGGWLWLRQSSLVAIQRVSITGLSGAEAPQIRAALTASARTMTTLDASDSVLRRAVAAFPVVKGLRIATEFPHSVRIRVLEQIPVAAVMIGGHPVPVASDGTILHGSAGGSGLPLIPLRVPPGGDVLTAADGLASVELLAAAPYQLLPHITTAQPQPGHGLTAQLRQGPVIYFGDANDLAAKWAAAAAVLSDSGAAGAEYIDVSDPGRPAAGVNGISPATAASLGASGTAAAAAPVAGATTSAPGSPAAGTSAGTGAAAPSAGIPPAGAAAPAGTNLGGSTTSSSTAPGAAAASGGSPSPTSAAAGAEPPAGGGASVSGGSAGGGTGGGTIGPAAAGSTPASGGQPAG